MHEFMHVISHKKDMSHFEDEAVSSPEVSVEITPEAETGAQEIVAEETSSDATEEVAPVETATADAAVEEQSPEATA